MTPLQNFVIALVLAALGFAALFQVIQADPIWKMISILTVGVIAAIGSLIFFAMAARNH